MKKLHLLLLLLPFTIVAQIPAGYYGTAEGKNSAELKTALHDRIKGHTQRSYANLWTDFLRTDNRTNGAVWDMYSNCTFVWGPVAQGGQQDGGGAANSECILYNREHSWPQSWFGGAVTPMHTDLFHIYPTDKYVNAQRGNWPYGEVNSPTRTYGNGSKLGPNSLSGHIGTVFEPIDEYKGDFARTYFYMVTRYENLISGWFNSNAGVRPTIDGTTYPAFQPWQLEMLLRWHRLDPVSPKETARNDSVFKIQHNRNPFIDHPELAEFIWGDSIAYEWRRGYGDDEYEEPDYPDDLSFFENFETLVSGTRSNTYNGNTLTFRTGQWNIRGVTTMDGNDRRNGDFSVRLRGNDTDAQNHFVEMQFDKPNGIGTVTFKYGSYGGNSGGRLRVQVSTDGGVTWEDYGDDTPPAPSWTEGGSVFQTHSVVVNTPSSGRIRIVKLPLAGSTLNIDDIGITDFFPPTPTLTVYPDDIVFDEVVINTPSEALSVTVSGENLLGDIFYVVETPGYDTTTLLFEDFGTAAVAAPWPLVAEYTGYRKEGAGAANVSYATSGGAVSVRSNAVSSGYSGASGACNAMMAAAGATFLVNNINPMGAEKILLSFGTNQRHDTIALAYSMNGTTWTTIPYEKTTTTWGLVEVEFDIPNDMDALHLRFTAGITQFGARVDDITVAGVRAVVKDEPSFIITPIVWDPAMGGTLGITFAPTETKTYYATLRFSSAGVDDEWVALTGTGLPDLPCKCDTATLNTIIAGLQDEISTLQTEVSGLKTDTAMLNTTIAELQKNIAGLEGDITNLTTTNTALQDTIGDLHLLLVEWITLTDELFDTIEALRQRLADCGTSSNTAQAHHAPILQIHPNPVNYELTITNYEWQPGDVVELFDITGRRVYSAPPVTGHQTPVTIDMSPFPQGTYILRIGNHTARVIKQ